eukprot:147958_1
MAINDDGTQSQTCGSSSHVFLTGCSATSPWLTMDGHFPGTVPPHERVPNVDYSLSGHCTVVNGVDDGPNKGTYGHLVCCDSPSYALQCVIRYGEQSGTNSESTTTCGTGYRMTGCSGSGIFRSINAWYIIGDTCIAHTRYEPGSVWAIAICCKLETDSPTAVPTQPPTRVPSMPPTKHPTFHPTVDPTTFPTLNPTMFPTLDPTIHPTLEPSMEPTTDPTFHPTQDPTTDPTLHPTLNPTIYPTMLPTLDPTILPTLGPTMNPTIHPSLNPTIYPTMLPTRDPTILPTLQPTMNPTFQPTLNPTIYPTTLPTLDPTILPTLSPTLLPTLNPTIHPTPNPCMEPTTEPTFHPTQDPTTDPTVYPTFDPTMDPTFQPTRHPTVSEAYDSYFNITYLLLNVEIRDLYALVNDTMNATTHMIDIIEISYMMTTGLKLQFFCLQIYTILRIDVDNIEHDHWSSFKTSTNAISLGSTIQCNRDNCKLLINPQFQDDFISTAQEKLRVYFANAGNREESSLMFLVDADSKLEIHSLQQTKPIANPWYYPPFVAIVSFVGIMIILSLLAFMDNKGILGRSAMD